MKREVWNFSGGLRKSTDENFLSFGDKTLGAFLPLSFKFSVLSSSHLCSSAGEDRMVVAKAQHEGSKLH